MVLWGLHVLWALEFGAVGVWRLGLQQCWCLADSRSCSICLNWHLAHSGAHALPDINCTCM